MEGWGVSVEALSLIVWLLLVALYVVVRIGVARERRAALAKQPEVIVHTDATDTTGVER